MKSECSHPQLMAVVKSTAITGTRTKAVDLQLRCMTCDKEFIMMGTPVGINTPSLRILAEPKV